MKIYTGTKGWGWRLFGIGFGSIWFLGLSIREKENIGGIDKEAMEG